MDAETAEGLLELAEDLLPRVTGSHAKDALEPLEERSDDLTAAIAWFVDSGHTHEALRLANALYRYWITSRRFEEGARWFERVFGSEGGDCRPPRPRIPQRWLHALLDG